MKLPEIKGKVVEEVIYMGKEEIEEDGGILIKFTDNTHLLIGYAGTMGGIFEPMTDWKYMPVIL